MARRSGLTLTEIDRGWVEHVCPDHGFLVATTPKAVVICKCRKRARRERNGQVLHRQEIARLVKSRTR